MLKYYFLHDNSVQWFSYCVAFDEKQSKIRPIETFSVDLSIECNTIKSILERDYVTKEVHLLDTSLTSFLAWSISNPEYMRLKKIVCLFPRYLEYLESCKLN